MNTDEYEHSPENTDEYDNTSFVYHESIISDDSTEFTDINTKIKKNGKYVDEDPGHKIIGKKKSKLEYFATSIIPGNTIRNAVTGIPEYNMKVGNGMIEDQFFKIKYAGNDCGDSPDTLYYDNPEQCERHMNCRIRNINKKNWQDKYNRAISRISE